MVAKSRRETRRGPAYIQDGLRRRLAVTEVAFDQRGDGLQSFVSSEVAEILAEWEKLARQGIVDPEIGKRIIGLAQKIGARKLLSDAETVINAEYPDRDLLLLEARLSAAERTLEKRANKSTKFLAGELPKLRDQFQEAAAKDVDLSAIADRLASLEVGFSEWVSDGSGKPEEGPAGTPPELPGAPRRKKTRKPVDTAELPELPFRDRRYRFKCKSCGVSRWSGTPVDHCSRCDSSAGQSEPKERVVYTRVFRGGLPG